MSGKDKLSGFLVGISIKSGENGLYRETLKFLTRPVKTGFPDQYLYAQKKK